MPTVRPLVERILETLRRLKIQTEAIVRKENLDPDSPDLMNRLKKDGEIARLAVEIKASVEEIHTFGCICKGVEQGLLDFPCMLGEEVVFLCWQYGEPSVGHWHRVEDGYAGRRPLLDPDEDPGGNKSYH